MNDEKEALLRRAEDLAEQCRRRGQVTHTVFLTPGEQHTLSRFSPVPTLLLPASCERRVLFFLPDWLEPEDLDPADWLCALRLTARFGSPGHRDWLGAVLALGIGREWVGDILAEGETAYLYCLPSVREHLLLSLDRVGRWGAKAEAITLEEVPSRQQELRERTFSVKSLRLDAVCGGMFSLSRTAAAEAIAAGLVSLNYEPCLKTDAGVKAGDVISLRGKGKGWVLSAGDRESKKGRLFVTVGTPAK